MVELHPSRPRWIRQGLIAGAVLGHDADEAAQRTVSAPMYRGTPTLAGSRDIRIPRKSQIPIPQMKYGPAVAASRNRRPQRFGELGAIHGMGRIGTDDRPEAAS